MVLPATDVGPVRAVAAAAGEGLPLPDNATAGFVETFGLGICRGRYAALLQQEWHRWDQQHDSENDPVDIFGDDQLFVVSGLLGGWVSSCHLWDQHKWGLYLGTAGVCA